MISYNFFHENSRKRLFRISCGAVIFETKDQRLKNSNLSET